MYVAQFGTMQHTYTHQLGLNNSCTQLLFVIRRNESSTVGAACLINEGVMLERWGNASLEAFAATEL